MPRAQVHTFSGVVEIYSFSSPPLSIPFTLDLSFPHPALLHLQGGLDGLLECYLTQAFLALPGVIAVEFSPSISS